MIKSGSNHLQGPYTFHFMARHNINNPSFAEEGATVMEKSCLPLYGLQLTNVLLWYLSQKCTICIISFDTNVIGLS